MMQNSMYIGHLGPIPLYIHWSAIFLVIMGWYWVGGSNMQTFDIGFFVCYLAVLLISIVLHEMGHGMAARAVARNEAERSVTITLQAFGGVCMSKGDHSPWKRLVVVLAGPAVSLALWLLGAAVIIATTTGQWGDYWRACVMPGSYEFALKAAMPEWVASLLLVTTSMNLILLIFNMLPIYPFDGGQTLYNILKLMIRDWNVVRQITMALSVTLALMYFTWVWHSTGQISFYLAIMYAFMLYNAYISLFVYRQ